MKTPRTLEDYAPALFFFAVVAILFAFLAGYYKGERACGNVAATRTRPDRTHATDCTMLADGVENELCLEVDSERYFTCQPVTGRCDTPEEWIYSAKEEAR